MKKLCPLLLAPRLLAASVLLNSLQGLLADEPAVIVKERGQFHRAVERVSVTNGTGQVSLVTNRWTDLGDNLHYLQNGQWLETQELLQLHPLGLVGLRAPFKAIFSADISSVGSFDILTTDDVRLRGNIVGIRYSVLRPSRPSGWRRSSPRAFNSSCQIRPSTKTPLPGSRRT